MILSKHCNDLTNKTFGLYTVIEPINKDKYGSIIWSCKCACGNISNVRSSALINGHSKSCGCINRKQTSKNAYKERLKLIGKKINRLTVIDITNKKDSTGTFFLKFKCICGKQITARYKDVFSGNTKSCGCLKSEKYGESHPNWNPDREYIVKKNKCYKFMLRLNQKIKSIKNNKTTQTITGYSIKDLYEHLEKQFNKKMTWENHGSYWEIDHIVPVSSFIKKGIIDPKIINALINLQPLEKIANKIKGNRILH